MAESGDPGETLQRTAELIAERFATDVCSVYTLEPDGHRVRLAATASLAPESVGRIRLHSGQGLTGMVLEQNSPVFVSRPWEHPRFAYFRDSGEERLSTFLGVPLVYQQELLGVLVVQTEAEDGLTPDQTDIFQAIASQIAALVAYTGLLRPGVSETVTAMEEAGKQPRPHRREEKVLIRGNPVSSGFGWGPVHFLEGGVGFDSVSEHPVEDPGREVRRFERNAERYRSDMERLASETPDLAEGDRAILQAQAAILEDPGFRSKVRRTIEEGTNAEYALKNAVADYIRLLHGVSDPYLQARGKDVEDAGRMVLSHLLGAEHAPSAQADREGDKILPYLDAPQEDNPALGWRSIRISLELESVFRKQIRAILRASRLGGVRILFPMVTAVWEMRIIRSLLQEEMEQLRNTGEAPADIPELGIMLEVPATVKILDKLLPWVDFVSIGTNDPIQYALAADRNNARVEPWSSPLHPAVIRILEEARAACDSVGIPLSVCGEAASSPAFARLLLGMGFTRLSMSPTAIPSIKHAIRRFRAEEAARDLKHTLTMEEPEQVRDYLRFRLEQEMADSVASRLH